MGRLISDANGNWSVVHFDSTSIPDEIFICLFWLESKFRPDADAGWPAQGYGLGQMTRIGAREIDRYSKSADFYPTNKHDKIVNDVGLQMALLFKDAKRSEDRARSPHPIDQIGTSIELLTIKKRLEQNDIRKGLKAYGPPNASFAKYADVILHCADCIKTSQSRDNKGVPRPCGQAEVCGNCLERADQERSKAYGN
jgi:hypothetical protein